MFKLKFAIEPEILAEFEMLNINFVLNKKKEEHGRNSWNKCIGDITSKLFSHCIKKNVKGKYDISGENSFIEGFPYEFDLLIIEKRAKPYKFTSIYRPQDVVCCMEFKSKGAFKNEEQLKKYAEEFKRRLKLLKEVNKRIEMIHLTMKVQEKYFQRTKKYFEPEIKCLKICQELEVNLTEEGAV